MIKSSTQASGGKTCAKPRSRRKYERQVAGLEKHLETNPNDVEARKRLTTARERRDAV